MVGRTREQILDEAADLVEEAAEVGGPYPKSESDRLEEIATELRWFRPRGGRRRKVKTKKKRKKS